LHRRIRLIENFWEYRYMDLRRFCEFLRSSLFVNWNRIMRLVIDGLASIRSGRPVFSGLGLVLEAGEALAIMGPNGAGKSSLLRIVAGLLPASEGSLQLQGGDTDTPLSEQAHYLGHRDALKPALTPFETLTFWQSLLGRPLETPLKALARVGLGHTAHLPSGYLSAGQRRRLALARMLIAHRPLWLLDEPTSALDAASEAMFNRLVAAHLASGGMVMVATHAALGFACRTFMLGDRS
jgi:heme exporter protein A